MTLALGPKSIVEAVRLLTSNLTSNSPDIPNSLQVPQHRASRPLKFRKWCVQPVRGQWQVHVLAYLYSALDTRMQSRVDSGTYTSANVTQVFDD